MRMWRTLATDNFESLFVSGESDWSSSPSSKWTNYDGANQRACNVEISRSLQFSVTCGAVTTGGSELESPPSILSASSDVSRQAFTSRIFTRLSVPPGPCAPPVTSESPRRFCVSFRRSSTSTATDAEVNPKSSMSSPLPKTARCRQHVRAPSVPAIRDSRHVIAIT